MEFPRKMAIDIIRCGLFKYFSNACLTIQANLMHNIYLMQNRSLNNRLIMIKKKIDTNLLLYTKLETKISSRIIGPNYMNFTFQYGPVIKLPFGIDRMQ